MIIKYPTKFYVAMLPHGDSPGNVIYTISDNDPPTYNENFFQLPLDQEIRKLPDRVYNKQSNRSFNGKLVFDIIIPGQSVDESGSFQYEIGQILDFTTTDNTTVVDSYNIDTVEMRQNLWTVDYEIAGLSDTEYQELLSAASTKYDSISLQIADIGTQINGITTNISSVQANINSSTKLLNSLLLVFGEGYPTVIKVQNKINEYEVQNTELINTMNILQEQLTTLTNEQNNIREVIR